MMKYLALIVSLVNLSAHAEVLRSGVHSVEGNLIKLANGRVVFMENNKSLLNTQEMSDKLVEFHVDHESRLLSHKIIGEAPENKLLELLEEVTPPAYEPTLIPSLAEAEAIFNRLNTDYKRRSECSDRAHIWAWEEFKNHGIKSEKVFAFFTATYINRTGFKWWFHVAPLITVQTENGPVKMVLDYQFKTRPVPVKEWTDMMVFSKRECKMTKKFSEYDVNPQTEDCYMMIDSMYYRLPGDLHAQELQGQYRISFDPSEVKATYRYAFKTVKEVNP